MKMDRQRWSVTLWCSAGFSLLAAVGLLAVVAVFVWQSRPFWQEAGAGVLTGKQWFFRRDLYGIAPMVHGTLVVAGIALGVAVPLGLGTSIFLSDFLPSVLRPVLKGGVELLAAIPSVVYGLLGILLLRDWIYEAFTRYGALSGDTLLTAGLLLAVMLLPTLISLSDDALAAVPVSQKLAARSLGLRSSEVMLQVVVPQAGPGLVAAVLLAAGRACGEMIAVFLVVGRQDNQWPDSLFSLPSLLHAGQTMATKLGSSELSIAYGHPLHWGALMALGLVLLLLVFLLTLTGQFLQKTSVRDET